MLFGLGAFALVTTLVISYQNPRAIFWLLLGSAKVLICSFYDLAILPYGMGWAPDGLFVSLIATAVFCHLLEKYHIYEWELVLYRLVFFSMLVSAARFLDMPVISELYDALIYTAYGASFVLIFANSLKKSELLDEQTNQALDGMLSALGANSRRISRKQGWAQRWL